METKEKKKIIPAVLLAVAIAIAGILLHRLAGYLLKKLPVETYWYQRMLIQTVSALLSVGWLFLFRKQFVLREKGRPFRTCWMPFLVILLYCATVALRQASGQTAPVRPIPEIIAFCLTMLLVGVSEELLHRGVILNILTAAIGTKTYSGAVVSCFIGGTLFGLIHLFNMLSGISPAAVIIQTAGAIGAGWLLSALYLRSRNIYLLIAAHALNDGAAMTAQGIFSGQGTVENAIAAVTDASDLFFFVKVAVVLFELIVFGAFTMLLLRKNKMQYPET